MAFGGHPCIESNFHRAQPSRRPDSTAQLVGGAGQHREDRGECIRRGARCGVQARLHAPANSARKESRRSATRSSQAVRSVRSGPRPARTASARTRAHESAKVSYWTCASSPGSGNSPAPIVRPGSRPLDPFRPPAPLTLPDFGSRVSHAVHSAEHSDSDHCISRDPQRWGRRTR